MKQIEAVKRPFKEDQGSKTQDSASPGKIGPFIVFALFLLHNNEQRGATVGTQFCPGTEISPKTKIINSKKKRSPSSVQNYKYNLAQSNGPLLEKI